MEIHEFALKIDQDLYMLDEREILLNRDSKNW